MWAICLTDSTGCASCLKDLQPAVNAQSTEAAREKPERIKDRFKAWVWSGNSHRERLGRFYNDTFNHTRLRTKY